MRESHHTFISKWKLDTLSVKFLQDATRLLTEMQLENYIEQTRAMVNGQMN